MNADEHKLIEGDVLRIVVKVPEFDKTKGAISPGAQDEIQSGTQQKTRPGAHTAGIIRILGSGQMSAADLVSKLGLKSNTGVLKRSLQKLLDKGWSNTPSRTNRRVDCRNTD